jgi:hypothetical protein
MEAIKYTVKNVLQELEAKQKPGATDAIQDLLGKVFTKKERKHIKLRYFKKGTLSLNVDSSSWLYHFSLQKDKLLAKMQRKSRAIKNLRFSIGETQ